MRMKNREVLISGAGVAGPTLAYWLLQNGMKPVIVERSPAFRAGGYIVDFWGVGFDVAERMGLVPELEALGYRNDFAIFVDRKGRRRSGIGGETLRRVLGDRFLSILRGDLALLIYQKLEGGVETIFGDEVTDIVPQKDSVRVDFRRSPARTFELVIGADGLHSGVRRAAFGKKAGSTRYLGYHAAVFITEGYSRRDEHTYLSFALPGRQVSRFTLRDGKTGFLFVFSWPDEELSFYRTTERRKILLRDIYAGDGWEEWPEIERHLAAASDLYFDSVSQVELPRWSKDRVALVGDAAYCPSLLAGEGAAFAMAGAYILANELGRATDHAQAFLEYERKFRPFILRKQKAARNFAKSFTPSTSLGLVVRDVVLKLGAVPPIGDFLVRHFIVDDYAVPEYGPAPGAMLSSLAKRAG